MGRFVCVTWFCSETAVKSARPSEQGLEFTVRKSSDCNGRKRCFILKLKLKSEIKQTAQFASLLHTSARGCDCLSLLCMSAEWRFYGSVEQLVTGRKNLTRPPLWISCL